MATKYKFNSDVETVFELLTDPDFLVERSMELGELSADCEVIEEGDEIKVIQNREVERDLPAFFAKMFDPVQKIEMVETWIEAGDGYSGTLSYDVIGQPVTITGKFALKPKGKGCEYTVEHTPKAKIPLIGKRVEKFIAGQTAEGVVKELDYAKEKLG